MHLLRDTSSDSSFWLKATNPLSWGLGSCCSLGQRAMGNYIFLSTCEGPRTKLGEGWLEAGEPGLRGGTHFSSLSLSFLLC